MAVDDCCCGISGGAVKVVILTSSGPSGCGLEYTCTGGLISATTGIQGKS